MLVMAAATFVSVFNQSTVNVAMPLIQRDFGVSEGEVGWVSTGYLLVFAVGVPLYGRVSDLYSPKITFCGGLAGLAAGSLLCALAPSLTVLVAGRVLQAAGAAAIPALSFGLVAKVMPAGSRGFALGLLSSSIGAGAAFGPVFGGMLIGLSGWHTLFYGTLALTLILLASALWLVPGSVASEDKTGSLDLPSGMLMALAAGLLLFGVTESQVSGLLSATTLGSFLGSLVCAIGFFWRIHRVAEPFVAPALLENRGFLAAASVGFLAQFANVCSLFIIPILVAQVLGASGLVAGLVLVPGAIVVAVLSPFAGKLSDRFGFRTMITLGLCAMLASELSLSTFGAGGSLYTVTFGMLLLGIGFAALNSPTANAASATLPSETAGVGLGIYQMCFFLGAGFGPAISGAFLTFREKLNAGALNPLYTLHAASFSDTFLVAGAAVILAFAAVSRVARGTEEGLANR